ncbi:glycerophosphodiester phosphodiesterase [Niveibacterium umoris]|uniref:Glycerophosphoryl diester phosphodiesterase n=1 Tax=Niveibacterium umoris TaxID=1193620 RepID=A0A840BLT1_9RHOO|nr:glycerophosphodiester phosphodiesterase [Niveibacterium umoris]MBB4011846.1 glycerophosphoryl diester phosphodiesterase [Niveibacterium umoris]
MGQWSLPRIVAHRCGGTLAPENTLIGLEFALAHGCRGVEFDVMLSVDRTPILIHDETLERTTNGRGRVCETSDATLHALDAGAWRAERFAGERIPFFADAIRRCRALGIAANVEIKPAAGFERETGRIAAEVAARGWAGDDRLPVLSSFSLDALEAAAAAAPTLPRAILFDTIPADWALHVRRLGAAGLVCNAKRLTPAVAASVKQADLMLGVYTENDPECARALLGWGVDSVITDRPDLLAVLA